MACYRSLSVLISSGILILSFGCDTWVEDVEQPEAIITDNDLTLEQHVGALINGVVSVFGLAYSQIAFNSGVLSDEFVFDLRNPGSRSGSLRNIDAALIPFGDSQVKGQFATIGRLRYLADDLIRRVGEIPFENQDLKRRAEFTGYFYGAVARYLLAGYYGLTEREGGGVISLSPSEPGQFVPSADMYRMALDKLELTLSFSESAETRIVNTLKARILLLLGDIAEARASAQSGMAQDDVPLQVAYGGLSLNPFWLNVGADQKLVSVVADFTYKEYVDADGNEAGRLPVVEFVVVAGMDSTILYRQGLYTSGIDPLPFCTWQENELILAELDLDDGNEAGALSHVNTVRASHGLDGLTTVSIDVLEVERRKELWMMGLRLIDQRRFGSWHKGPDTWWHFPIPQDERDLNPNL